MPEEDQEEEFFNDYKNNLKRLNVASINPPHPNNPELRRVRVKLITPGMHQAPRAARRNDSPLRSYASPALAPPSRRPKRPMACPKLKTPFLTASAADLVASWCEEAGVGAIWGQEEAGGRQERTW
jgi:hypothetical protein